MEITLEKLQDMGVRSSALRWYLWFKHFVEVGNVDVAAYFLGKCWRHRGDLPESWTALRDELDAARSLGCMCPRLRCGVQVINTYGRDPVSGNVGRQ